MKRRRARDLSPEFLYTISGIGPKGRIRKKGVDAYKARTMTISLEVSGIRECSDPQGKVNGLRIHGRCRSLQGKKQLFLFTAR
jgi:hypothetical protein